MDGRHAKILHGIFAGHEGELVSSDGDSVVVRVEVAVRRDEVELPEDVVARLLAEVEAEYDTWAEAEKLAFFLDRLDRPDDDLTSEWDAYLRHLATVEALVEERRSGALTDFQREIAPLAPDEAAARVAADPERWAPGRTELDRGAPDETDDEDGYVSAEERLLAAIEGRRPSHRNSAARARRQTARNAAEEREYVAWRAAHQPPDEQAREAALARVARDRPAIEERFARDWGFELPDSVFRFWAFLLMLGEPERQALRSTGLQPCGVMDLFADPAAVPRDGIDVRVHGRYYRDPPEFATFLHGGTDGLHFGLWYDDGRTYAGVASYYNKDGGGVGLPSGTPLEVVRDRLERQWDNERSATLSDGPLDAELMADLFGLRALREVLTTLETGDRPEEGAAYGEKYGPADELTRYGDRRRWETLDGGGALVDGEPAIDRGRQHPGDDYYFCTALFKELTGDPDVVRAHVAEARERCSLGDPASALTLGRDLHWASGGDPERERLANELLVLAYDALDRPNLAAIAAAHHRHRDLPQVTVLQPLRSPRS